MSKKLSNYMLTALILIAYLVGSINSAIILSKVLKLPDPRAQGSKNPGATNMLRIGGKKIAAFVLLIDVWKGLSPILLAYSYTSSSFELSIIALFAFLGHVYPVFYSFKGGKGVATFIGGLIGINPLVGLSFILIWLFVAKVLNISSLSALVATLLTPIFFYFIEMDIEATGVIALICLWIFFTHRSNIKRLVSGEEGQINS
ncbi:glycerol-3-phosphate 1-O-acyltransferase PlsY [Gammaproteobacteria bacterium]|nr:glycerol-3-phosphate 1-O-acyltransferase PlsY [Gammaproteobacteria bacterium]